MKKQRNIHRSKNDHKLAKHKELHKTVHPHHKKKKKNKLIIIIILASLVYLVLFREELRPVASQALFRFELLLSDYEILFSIYSHLKENVFSVSYMGVAYVMFFFSLFFLPAPIEVIFAGYLITGLNPWIVALVSAAANTLGHIVDFLLGVLFGKHFLKKSKPKIISMLDWFKKNGSGFLFIFNLFPLPAQFISVAYGFVKFNLLRFTIITFIARLLKFAIIILLFSYSRPFITAFLGI